MVLTHGIPPSIRDGLQRYHQSPSGQSRVNRALQLRTDGVHYRASAGTGSVALKVVLVMGAAISGFTMNPYITRLSFPKPNNIGTYVVDMHGTKSIFGVATSYDLQPIDSRRSPCKQVSLAVILNIALSLRYLHLLRKRMLI